MKYLYQSHPGENILQSVIPLNLWNARINLFPIPYSDLKAIRDVIRRLVNYFGASEPDLVLFFATGSLPYVLPAINLLGETQGEALLERLVFHMFPGLAWSGRIGGHSSEDFFINEVLLLLQQSHSRSKTPKIVCVDTTNTGNAVNKILKAMRRLCDRFPSELEVNVIGIVNGADAIATTNDQISIEYGEASIAHVIRPGEVVLADRVKSFDSSALRWIPETNSSRFFLSYWVLDRLLTEDKAALVGATSIHHRLAVKTDSSTGRLLIAFDNGTSIQVASAGTVGKQLSGLLTLKEDHPSWVNLDEHSRMPLGDHSSYGDFADLQTEALQSFEIDEDVDALAGIRVKKAGLLTAAEIWALAEARYFDAQTRAMVRAAQRKAKIDSLVHEAGQSYFQLLEQFCHDCCHEAGHATARYLNGD